MGKPVSEEEVFSRIDFHGDSGCWNWLGTLTQGYGCVTFRRRNWMTHRFVYETFCEAVPEGMVLDHLCRNRRCCNPDHLEVVTQVENLRRKPAKIKEQFPRYKTSKFYRDIVKVLKQKHGDQWKDHLEDCIPFTVRGEPR